MVTDGDGENSFSDMNYDDIFSTSEILGVLDSEGLKVQPKDSDCAPLVFAWNRIAGIERPQTSEMPWRFTLAGGIRLAIETKHMTNGFGETFGTEVPKRLTQETKRWIAPIRGDARPSVSALEEGTEQMLFALEHFRKLNAFGADMEVTQTAYLTMYLFDRLAEYINHCLNRQDFPKNGGFERFCLLKDRTPSLRTAFESCLDGLLVTLEMTGAPELFEDAAGSLIRAYFYLCLADSGRVPYTQLLYMATWGMNDDSDPKMRFEIAGFRELGCDWGEAETADSRQFILCSKTPVRPEAFLRELPEGIFLTEAQDLKLYNRMVGEPSARLVFPAGHPCDDTVYVQHPACRNVYCPLETFQAEMVYAAYTALMRQMRDMGATSVSLTGPAPDLSGLPKVVAERLKALSHPSLSDADDSEEGRRMSTYILGEFPEWKQLADDIRTKRLAGKIGIRLTGGGTFGLTDELLNILENWMGNTFIQPKMPDISNLFAVCDRLTATEWNFCICFDDAPAGTASAVTGHSSAPVSRRPRTGYEHPRRCAPMNDK